MAKRVTFLHPHCMLAGGATTFLLQVAQQLAAKGWEVYIVSIRSDASIIAETKRRGVTFVDVGGPLSSSIWFWVLYPFMFWRIYRATQRLQPSVIVSGPFPANWWGWFYKLLQPNSRLVCVCHEPTAFIYSRDWINSIKPFYMRWGLIIANPLFRWLEKQLFPISDLIDVNSYYTRQQLQRIFPGISAKRYRLIYCGISHQHFYEEPTTERLPQLVTVGVLSKFKNTDLVIRALHVLHQHEPYQAIRLVIKGKGFEKEALQTLIRNLNLTHAVQIIEDFYTDEQLADLLRSSFALIHAAHNEPFGLSVIEAQACGTPALVTGTGGTAETVSNGESGLYFEPGNAADLAKKIAYLYDNTAEWKRLSAGAVGQASQFRWERTGDEVEALLDEALRL